MSQFKMSWQSRSVNTIFFLGGGGLRQIFDQNSQPKWRRYRLKDRLKKISKGWGAQPLQAPPINTLQIAIITVLINYLYATIYLNLTTLTSRDQCIIWDLLSLPTNLGKLRQWPVKDVHLSLKRLFLNLST